MIRLTPAFFLAGLASMCLLGCNSEHDKRIQLRYMAWGNIEQLELEQRVVDEFNTRNPDIHVRLFKVPQSAYKNKMIVMFASRTAPDVVRVDHYDFPQLVDRNYFKKLDPYIEKDAEYRPSDYYPLALQECKSNGKVYGLNVLFGGGIMFYNKNILREAGLEDPYELWKKRAWTFDKLTEYARALTKFDATGRPQQFGVNLPTMPFYLAVIQAFGGKLLNEKLDKCLLDSPESIQGMQWITDLRWKYRCTPTPAQGANSAFAFETGKLAFEFNYLGMSARYRQLIKTFEWDVCPMPLGPKNDSFFVKGNQLVMYQETKHPDAAWRFMKFLVGPVGEDIMYVQARRQAPTRIDLGESKAFLHPKDPPYNIESLALTIVKGKTLPIGPRWSEVVATLTPSLDALFNGTERDAGPVMRKATKEIDKVLSEEPGL